MESSIMRSILHLRRGTLPRTCTGPLRGGADDTITPCPPALEKRPDVITAAAALDAGTPAAVLPPMHPQAGSPYWCGDSRRASAGSSHYDDDEDKWRYFDDYHGAGAGAGTGTTGVDSAAFCFGDEGELGDGALWRRMLAIQREFHCYNSARMDAALAAEDEGVEDAGVVPSRTCLDLLNDSISTIPLEARDELVRFIQRGRKRRSWKGW